ncbi:hypothetical protein [Dickeya solani]|uniref:Uncharacterized protein n=1 Tax=Dickeya solani TaxID=1089444 RepID=A0ABU4EK71_9GAMM|nr:hypothetical protein [Dickeya solani]MCA7000771.1 hypothetical protein [Dickeya solani]MCZ0823761.1 hypothetical protein [Dickeya solani]MDV6997649.1 hypothetical protein [Dickeya solani]MDV7006196.1 hypothetical protein [Dickeya solani]MDV7039516.1 hypothetical protein [Dickeya solani]
MQEIRVIKAFSFSPPWLMVAVAGLMVMSLAFLYGTDDDYSLVRQYRLEDNVTVNILQLESGGATAGFIYRYTVSVNGGEAADVLKTNSRDADIRMQDGVLVINVTGDVYRLDNRIRLHGGYETLKTRITVTHP